MKMDNRLVSVIIPSYNSSKTIRYCLDAVFNQNYKHIEVLVVDDHSSDDSEEIVKEYDCTLLKTPQNGGPSLARNVGAEAAKGEILFFVDSDVEMLPDAIVNCMEEFDAHPDAGSVCGVYTDKMLIDDGAVEDYRNLQSYYWRQTSVGYVNALFVSIGAIRKDVYFEMGQFNNRLRQSEDLEFGMRIAAKYKILLSSRVMGSHDHDDTLKRLLKNFFQRAAERVPLYKTRGKFLSRFETANRGIGIILAALSLFSLVLGFMDVRLLAVPAVLFAGFLATDFGQYIYVLKKRNFPFVLFFILMHHISNLAMFLGLVKGTLELITGRSAILKKL